jgi:pimeloyl-ACP methyl ester carboxylesterase
LPTEVPNAEEKFNPSNTGLRPAWEEHWVDLADGRMRYLQAGSGRALILVHGLMGYSFSWRFAMPELVSHATAYAIDNLGAGLSPARDGMDCSMRASAERVLQFVDALGIGDFDLLGTSHGGAVVMMAAALCAERQDTRLKRLVLVAPVNPWSRHGRWLAPFVGRGLGALLFRNTIERWRSLDYLWLRRLFGDGSKIPRDSLEGYRRPVHENRAFRHAQRIVRGWTADLSELEQALPKIRNYPTLLMWGTRDRAVSFRSAETLRQSFRDCRLVAFEGVGHLPYEEAPQEFNRALVEFLAVRS